VRRCFLIVIVLGGIVGHVDVAGGEILVEQALAARAVPPLQDLGTIGGDSSAAYAVNDAGVIVGSAESPTTPDLDRAVVGDASTGALTELATTAGVRSRARGIAEDGTIVGDLGWFLCISWDCGGSAIWLRPGEPMGFVSTGGAGGLASAVNSDGIVVGETDVAGHPVAYQQHAYASVIGGGSTDLGTLGGGLGSTATAINEAGMIVGHTEVAPSIACAPVICGAFHAVYRPASGGPFVDIGTLGGDRSWAMAVNADGVVAGTSRTAIDGQVHAFTYDTTTDDLVDLGTLGGDDSFAYGINDAGWVVGASTIEGESATHAFAFDPVAGEMLDLGTLGGGYGVAADINNCGVVVGVSSTPDGNLRAFRTAFPAFPDVPVQHPFFADICWAEGNGVATGFADGSFRPTSSLSRQAMVAWLYRLAGSPAGPFPPSGFSDVGPTHPFATEIAWAVDADVAGGFPDGTFRPTTRVSRQALVAWLFRFAGSPAGPFPDPGFTDIGSSVFANEIWWAADAGVVAGYADGTFRPGASVTRQAAVAFLHRTDGL
jgi:probable HAF family extracellular repeat protein